MQPFRTHAANTNGLRWVRRMPSPLTDGGLMPYRTYFSPLLTVTGSPYGDVSAPVAVGEANDEYLHPRTAIPNDIACWSVPNSISSGAAGPIHVGKDAILYDTGCVGFTGSYTFHFAVTPRHFSVDPADFNFAPWSYSDATGFSDKLPPGAQEAVIGSSNAARTWRNMAGQSILREMFPPGTSDPVWDYTLRFVIFPGCGCRTSYKTATVSLQVETVTIQNYRGELAPAAKNTFGSACLLPSDGLQSSNTANSRSVTSGCPSGSLISVVPAGVTDPSRNQLVAGLDPFSTKDSIQIDCPSCGQTSVEVPHEIAKLIIENGCYTSVKINGDRPCLRSRDASAATGDAYQIIPDFSSSVGESLKNEVVCAPSCCLLVGTMVETANGMKAVENLRPGDRLVSVKPTSLTAPIDLPITDPKIRESWPQDYYIEQNMVTVTEVTAGFEMSYVVINGALKLTGEHALPVLRDGVASYMSASRVVVGDYVMNGSGMWILVHTKENFADMAATISLGTADGHLFLAEGVVVHNSDAGFQDYGFDFGGAVGVGTASGADEISTLEQFAALRSKIKVQI